MATLPEPTQEKGLTLNPKRVAGSEDCLNCGTELKGPFCYYCGQPDKRFLRFFPVMIREVFQDLFELDSRFTRTLKPLLLHPGKLTRDYIDGRRFRYTPPIRIYLFASVIFFLLAALATSTLDLQESTREDGTVTRTIGPIQMDQDVAPDESADTESLEVDDLDISIDGKPWHPVDNPVDIALFPARMNDWINEEIGKSPQKAKAIDENPKLLIMAIIDVLPTAVFFLLPVFALVMKFWYLFAKRFYIEHLIFSLHNHSFIFVIFILLVLFDWMEIGAVTLGVSADIAETVSSVIAAVFMFWIPVYMFIAMKRVYQQGWLLTIGKYLMVGWTYVIILGVTTGLAAAIGFLKL